MATAASRPRGRPRSKSDPFPHNTPYADGIEETAKDTAIAQRVLQHGIRNAAEPGDDDESTSLLNAAIAPGPSSRTARESRQSFYDNITVAMHEPVIRAVQTALWRARATSSSADQSDTTGAASRKRKRSPTHPNNEQRVVRQRVEGPNEAVAPPTASGRLRRPLPVSARGTASRQLRSGDAPAQSAPSSSNADAPAGPTRNSARPRRGRATPTPTSRQSTAPAHETIAGEDSASSEAEAEAEAASSESAQAQSTAQSGIVGLPNSLQQAYTTALRIYEPHIRPRVGPVLDLHKKLRQLRDRVRNVDNASLQLDEPAKQALQAVLQSITVVESSETDVENLYCEVVKSTIPHMTMALAELTDTLHSQGRQATTQLQPQVHLVSAITSLYTHIESLPRVHSFLPAPVLYSKWKARIKQAIVSINASLKLHENALLRALSDATYAENAPARAAALAERQALLDSARIEATASQRAAMVPQQTAMAMQQAAVTTQQPALATQPDILDQQPLLPGRGTQRRLVQAQEIEDEHSRTKRETHWANLHALRTLLERPQGTVYLTPLQLIVLKHTPLSDVETDAAAHAEAHRRCYLDPSEAYVEEWDDAIWSEEEDMALLDALFDAGGRWEVVLQLTCTATKGVRGVVPGPLGRWGVSAIVERGVFLARKAMRDNWTSRYQEWKWIVDPRLGFNEGLRELAQMRARAESRAPLRAITAGDVRQSVEYHEIADGEGDADDEEEEEDEDEVDGEQGDEVTLGS